MSALKLDGRILFLSADPHVVDAQLAGANPDLSEAGPLRDDVSTDEITPVAACVYFDHRLAGYPYTGFKARDRRPIGIDAVQNGGFRITVAGSRMTAELAGFTGMIAPDAETVRFLRERRGIDFTIAPWMCSDEGAPYADTIRIDCAALTPIVAAPGDPGNGIAIAQLQQRPQVDIAYGGSCTAGKRDDFDRYHEVLAWAAARELKVAPHVKLYLQFGTTAVRDYCIQRGYLDAFREVGAEVLQPGCGACANCGPGSSTHADQITVSAINRNFPGRSGPGQVRRTHLLRRAAQAVRFVARSAD
jgi:homoaconitase/3-isopropylmalate dehydratase large subunit